MKKAKEHADELITVYEDAVMNNNLDVFKEKLSNIFVEVAINEVNELRKARNIKLDSGLAPIFKDQRKKYGSICKIINKVEPNLLLITYFDKVIKELYPDIYDWYIDNVLI